jgi:hypothetical protein
MSSVPILPVGLRSWKRSTAAAEEIYQRMLRSTAALNVAGIAYAVMGGNAVASWVGSVDKAAARFTKDVDILLRREDLDSAKSALEPVGFIFDETFGVHMFV